MRATASKTNKTNKATTGLVTAREVMNALLRAMKNKHYDYQLNHRDAIKALTENTRRQFTWVAKDLYIASEMMPKIQALIELFSKTVVSGDGLHTLRNELNDIIRIKMDKLLCPGNVRVRSTCEVSQMASTWEYESELILVEEIKKAIQEIDIFINQ